MVKKSTKPPSQEYTLANWLVDRMQKHPHFEEINDSQCNHECSKLVKDFDVLVSENNGNNVSLIVTRLNNSIKVFEESPDIANLSPYIDFIKTIVGELDEIQRNIDKLGVAIQSAHDAFTLHKTSFLIDSITNMIVHMENNSKSFLQNSNQKVGKNLKNLGFASKQQEAVNTKKERKLLAEELKNACENIRSMIGSPETMPKGLIITLVMHLSQAISKIKTTEMREPLAIDFMRLLQTELNTIRHHFPDLAEAGENLQSAIEISTLTK